MLYSLSLVIPVYNSAAILPTLIARLEAVLPQIAQEYEVILVNDGSPDNSWQVIRRLAENRPWLRGILLMRNYGQHNALLAGIRAAQGEVIITMDDDLQHPPEEIPKLLAELKKGYDVVYGVPQAETHGLLRNLASRFLKWLMGVTLEIPHIPRSGAFRAFRTQVREAFLDYRSQFVSIDVLLSWGTNRFGFVTVRHDPRLVGKSTYTFQKLVRHTFNMLTGFSTLPLRLASLLGFAFTLFGLTVLIYVLGRYLLEGSSVQGFPFLASIIALFSGVQLFAIGIFGEYLARMYFRLMGRPPSVTRETIGLSLSEQSDD
ncbi:MAG: glycosyltransferase family 2 protein [Anaerolineales bacterium]|nr:glycosyltransferase family 2 protein [Anaerolineales bacterium]